MCFSRLLCTDLSLSTQLKKGYYKEQKKRVKYENVYILILNSNIELKNNNTVEPQLSELIGTYF